MFAAQVALAKRRNLTLVVHTRAGVGRHLRHPDAAASDRTGWSCTVSPVAPTKRAAVSTSDAFLSFSGIVTFKNADDVRAAAALCPLDRLLVETDAPFLAPVPHRGEDNRPALVSVVGCRGGGGEDGVAGGVGRIVAGGHRVVAFALPVW